MFRGLESETTEERSKLVFFLFYVLGTIGFLPLSFYVSANDYWMYKFRDPDVPYNSSDTDDKSDLDKDFTAYYSIVSHVCLIIFAVITVSIANRISIQVRLIGCLSILMLLFLIIKILIWVNTDSWQQGFFNLSLALGGLISGTGALFLISAIELSVKFSSLYTTALLSGHSLCGILAALIQILTLSMGLSSKINAMIYFSICGILILGTLVLYLVLAANNSHIQSKLIKEKEQEQEQEQETTTRRVDFQKVKRVARKLPIIMFIIFINTAYALVFPGITSLVESSGKGGSRWSDVFFVQVCTFLSFHLWDFIGREFSIRFNKVENNKLILAASVCRLLFIPLIIFCNVQPRNHLPVFFKNDTIFIILVILYGFSTGYIFNVCVIKTTRTCEPDERYIALIILVLAFVLSLVIFSFLGSVIVNLL